MIKKTTHYILPAPLAHELGLAGYRQGNEKLGYLVAKGDLVGRDLSSVEEEGGKAVTTAEAKAFVKQLKATKI